MDHGTYLTVHDAKAFEPDATRIGRISIDEEGGTVEFVRLEFPAAASGPSSDLESICRIPGRAGEFLLSESGYWQGDFGRVFHVRVSGTEVSLIHEFQLPKFRENNPAQLDGDQLEGLACFARMDGLVTVFLGERGGTDIYPTGIIRWGAYDADNGAIEWSIQEYIVEAPNPWGEPALRSITGLSIDNQDRLWASAAVDAGDFGPFRSVVYEVGTVNDGNVMPLIFGKARESHIVNGFKIEGVAAGDSSSILGIGIEGEAFGGTLRRLTLNSD